MEPNRISAEASEEILIGDPFVAGPCLRRPNEQSTTAEFLMKRRKFDKIIALGLCVTTLLLFVLYWQCAYTGEALSTLPYECISFLIPSALTNATVMTVALHIRGEPSRRLQASLFATVLLHATLICFIYIFRQAYSLQAYSLVVAILSFLSSIGLVTAISMIVERWYPWRIGIVRTKLGHAAWNWIPEDGSILRSPQTDVARFDLILFDWDALSDRAWREMLSRATLSGRTVKHVAKYVEERSGRVCLDHFEPQHALSVSSAFYLAYIKRPLDVLGAALLLLLSIPLLVLAMLSILISMGRPVFFVQNRVGRGGTPFRMYKLRTMLAADKPASCATRTGDRRITPLGNILRRTRIDELPQLWNVLIGNMSLIGPRPEQPELCTHYDELIPGFGVRHAVLPGITGLAQIRTGYAANVEETKAKLSYDLYYVKHASLLLDLRIVLDTVPAIVLGTSSR